MIRKEILIGVIILAAGLLIYLFLPSSLVNPDYNSKVNAPIQNNPELGIPNTNPETQNEDSESSSSTSSGESSTSSEGCSYQQISYSLQNFAINQSSNEATCSVTAYNLDTIGGEFGIRFRIHPINNSADTSFDSVIVTSNIEAGQNIQFIQSFTIPEEYSNTELTCSTSTSSVPRKLVC